MESGGYIVAESIASSPPQDETLFRGIHAVGETPDSIAQKYQVGSEFDTLPSSFSTDQSIAAEFIDQGSLNSGMAGTPVVFEMEPPSHAFNMEAVSHKTGFVRERERVTMGRMEVTGVETVDIDGIPTTVVKTRQKDLFDNNTISSNPPPATPKRRKRTRTTKNAPVPASSPQVAKGAVPSIPAGMVEVPGVGIFPKSLLDSVLAKGL